MAETVCSLCFQSSMPQVFVLRKGSIILSRVETEALSGIRVKKASASEKTPFTPPHTHTGNQFGRKKKELTLHMLIPFSCFVFLICVLLCDFLK